jgi:NAD(P)-dependent dehydrogenase (short-subunit alcohol dehydrogenase family)
MTNPYQADAPLFDLSGKTAWVTGASRGIGAAIAELLASRGAHVVVSSRKIESCLEVVNRITGLGGSASARACNIGDPDQIASALDFIEQRYGRIHILVNNAATNPYFGPAVDTDPAAFQKAIDVNIRGYFLASTGAIRLMQRTGGGAIVNVASISGITPGPNQGIYSITKAAVIAMTKVLASECGKDGIRVNAIAPGITDTRFAAALVHDDEMLAKYLPRVPLGRVAMPDEIAGAVLYLASSASSYTTGVCIPVDGGYLAR